MAKVEQTEKQLIAKYDKARAALEKAEDEMRLHFNNKTVPKIKTAKTLNETRLLKESLRVMPDSSSKMLLFRAILIQEGVITGTHCRTCLLELKKCSCY